MNGVIDYEKEMNRQSLPKTKLPASEYISSK